MREHTDTYEALAQRCENAARELEHVGENAAEVLTERGYGDWIDSGRIDPQTWGNTHTNAAYAARAYAAELRTEAGDNPTGRMDRDRLAQAERVAKAAELGGILIDGRPMAERTAQSGMYGTETDRVLWEAGTHPDQVKAAEIEATGRFTHVAETINGIEQVPFWRLGGPTDESTNTRHVARTDSDGDEF
ncbi:hypothetical protein Aca07nite_27830 [Actinoplanes capillaceus]|uniref:Uncharacterized protein n=1 Tax=Actinoplanes campanulatus TaxID=113559 RepID=A0ABQ3WGY2_9ACTN|nr:hypothetical protein [Actinoplanes capillaceus]GID45508.1 hypothetical protein Aca07nite_27830 [Actinoplanes capillaceus]